MLIVTAALCAALAGPSFADASIGVNRLDAEPVITAPELLSLIHI